MPGLVCLCSIVTRWSLTHCYISMFDLCMMLTPRFNTNLVTFIPLVDCCWGADYRKNTLSKPIIKANQKDKYSRFNNIISPFLPPVFVLPLEVQEGIFFSPVKRIISWFAWIGMKIYFILYVLFFCTLGSTASVQEEDIQSEDSSELIFGFSPCPCAQISILFLYQHWQTHW